MTSIVQDCSTVPLQHHFGIEWVEQFLTADSNSQQVASLKGPIVCHPLPLMWERTPEMLPDPNSQLPAVIIIILKVL